MAAHIVVVRGEGEIPIVAVASMEECGAVAKGDDGTDADVGGTVGLEGEVGCGNGFAKTEHGKGESFVDTPTADGVVGGQQMPLLVLVFLAPVQYIGVEVVLVEVRDDEIDSLFFAFGLFKEFGQQPIWVAPIVIDDEQVGFTINKAAMMDIV